MTTPTHALVIDVNFSLKGEPLFEDFQAETESCKRPNLS